MRSGLIKLRTYHERSMIEHLNVGAELRKGTFCTFINMLLNRVDFSPRVEYYFFKLLKAKFEVNPVKHFNLMTCINEFYKRIFKN
jgi:hypothetical protein